MSDSSLTLNSGHKMPQVGLGTWLSKPGEVGEAVRMSLEIGYRHIDCAALYQNQDEIGAVFKEIFNGGKVKREDVFVTTKVWCNALSYAKATASIDKSLKELQLSYLDLVLIHFPMGFQEGDALFPEDPNGNLILSDIDYLETWRALEDSVKAGKVRSIGLSNFNVKQIERVIQNCKIKPAVLQIESHPYLAQKELLDYCHKQGITVTAYSPLANNAHVFRKEGEPNLLEDKVIVEIAQKHKKTPAQVAIRWAIQKKTVVIPKSIRRTRLEENFNVWDFQLSEDEMAAIGRLDRNMRLLPLNRAEKHPNYPF